MKISSKHWILFAALFLSAGLGHAEEGCPPGMIPASGTNMNSCVPIPPGYYQQAPAPAPQPEPAWSNRFGAIATDFSHSSAGASIDRLSRSDAEQAALDECRTNGGINCKVEISYGNECVVLAIGKNGHNAKAGATIASATDSAMKVCNAADAGCFVYYSACSPPARIR